MDLDVSELIVGSDKGILEGQKLAKFGIRSNLRRRSLALVHQIDVQLQPCPFWFPLDNK